MKMKIKMKIAISYTMFGRWMMNLLVQTDFGNKVSSYLSSASQHPRHSRERARQTSIILGLCSPY
jgi:hypothetical protein